MSAGWAAATARWSSNACRMNPENIPLWAALFIEVALGIAVFRANTSSRSNQGFLLLSLTIAAWLISLQFAYNASSPNVAAFWIRISFISALGFVNGFYLLLLAIVHRDQPWRHILKEWRPWGLLSAAIAIAFSTSLVVKTAEIHRGIYGGSIPRPIWADWQRLTLFGYQGTLSQIFYAGVFITSGLGLVAMYVRK